MFTFTRNNQYYKALSVNIYFLLLGMSQSPVPIGILVICFLLLYYEFCTAFGS